MQNSERASQEIKLKVISYELKVFLCEAYHPCSALLNREGDRS